MQELVGRLTALDPEASAGLKVIAYFDALVDGHANPEVMLRGAAVLSGCAAGFVSGPITLRVDDSGTRQGPVVVLALRLTSDRTPLLDAEELGSVLLLAEAADLHAEPHPDRDALERVIRGDHRTLATLESMQANESLRGAATELGVHHSTLQARDAEPSAELGYDIRKPAGRTRLSLALTLYLLTTNRFD